MVIISKKEAKMSELKKAFGQNKIATTIAITTLHGNVRMSEPNRGNNPIYIYICVRPKMEILERVKTYKNFKSVKMVRQFGQYTKTLKFQCVKCPNINFGHD